MGVSVVESPTFFRQLAQMTVSLSVLGSGRALTRRKILGARFC
jgi:hypothetical protein